MKKEEKNLSEEKRRRITDLRVEGKTIEEISSLLDLSPQTVINATFEDKDRISTLQAVKTESLLNSVRANSKDRIVRLSEINDRLREEISRRDLTDLPTKDLIGLYLKMNSAIRDEVCDPVILSTEEQERGNMFSL